MHAIRTMALIPLVALLLAPGAAQAQKYVGPQKCKSCHNTADKGKQIDKWMATDHAKAFETLGSEESKKIAKKMGIEDPQKDAKCLKCHVTGFDAPADKLAASHKKEQGVSCEACHGPGDKHIKARMASEDESEGYLKLPEGEIVTNPGEKNCTSCHNKESPTFKGFKYAEWWKKIEHPVPAKKGAK